MLARYQRSGESAVWATVIALTPRTPVRPLPAAYGHRSRHYPLTLLRALDVAELEMRYLAAEAHIRSRSQSRRQQGQHNAVGVTDPVLYRLTGTPALRAVLPPTSRTPGLFRGVLCSARFCGPPGWLPSTARAPPSAVTGLAHPPRLRQYDRHRHAARPAVHQRLAQAGGLKRGSARMAGRLASRTTFIACALGNLCCDAN